MTIKMGYGRSGFVLRGYNGHEMKLKPILLLLPALMLVLVVCGGATEPTPDIDAMLEAKVKEALAAQATPTPIPTPTPTPPPQPTPKPTLTAQAIIDKSKMGMYQLNEYRFKAEYIYKTSNLEVKLVHQGDFQSPDKTEGFMELLNETRPYITIGTTCYTEIEKYGEKKWIQDECDHPGHSYPGLYMEFIPTKDTLMDLGIKATPELIDGNEGRPTAYLIDNGGSENLSHIKHTDFYKSHFSDDEGPGIPQTFRIRYWINSANFRLMDLVLSFHIPPESVTNHEEFVVKEGGFVDFTTVMAFRPLTERISDIKPP
jgi:hypothetical protein